MKPETAPLWGGRFARGRPLLGEVELRHPVFDVSQVKRLLLQFENARHIFDLS